MPAGGVSTRVSPVELMGAGCAPTGHITVAAVSCPLAPWACGSHTHQAAQGGPACEGWHSLPQDPGTFARWVSNAVRRVLAPSCLGVDPGFLTLESCGCAGHWSTGVALCAALTLLVACVVRGGKATGGGEDLTGGDVVVVSGLTVGLGLTR